MELQPSSGPKSPILRFFEAYLFSSIFGRAELRFWSDVGRERMFKGEKRCLLRNTSATVMASFRNRE